MSDPITRSGSNYSAPRDSNRVPLLMAASTSDDITPVVLLADPVTHLLQVSSSGGGGTQYTDGGVPPAHPVGGTIEWSDGSNWQTVSTAKPLPVTATFSPSGTQDVNLTKVGGSAIAIGQQLAAASLPVILPSATITTLTPPAAITNYALETGGNLASILADLTNATQKTQLVDGSGNVAAEITTGQAYSTGNALLTGFANYTYTLNMTSAVSVVVDVGNYSYAKLQVTALYSGQTAFHFECSNDNSNWFENPVTYTNNGGDLETITPGTTTGVYVGQLMGRYLRVRPSGAYSSGAMTGVFIFSTATPMARGGGVTATQAGTWTVGSNSATGSGVPANAFYMGINGDGNLRGIDSPAVDGDGANANHIPSSQPYVYNGTTYDRTRSANSGQATTGTGVLGAGLLGFDGTNYQRLTVNSTTVTSKFAADTNLLSLAGTVVAVGNGTTGNGTQRVTLSSDSTGQVAPAAAAAATGTSIYSNTALTSTKTAVKTSAGNLYGYHIYNVNNAVTYVQLFNATTANVTVGSTTPTAVLAIPANGWADAPPATPIAFATALTIAATTTATGSTAPGTAILVNFWYA